MHLFWTFLVFAVFFPLPISEFLSGPWVIMWQISSLGLMLGSLLLIPKSLPKFYSWWIFSFGAAAVATIMAGFSSEDPQGHWLTGAQILVFLSLGPVSFRSLLTAHPRLRSTVCWAFLMGQFFSALAAMGQAIGITVLGTQMSNGRAPGLAGHQNILGLMSGLSICLILYVVMRRRRNLAISAVAISINISSLLLSGSTSAMISTSIGLLILFYVLQLKAHKFISIMVALSASVSVYSYFSAKQDSLRSPLQRFQQVTGNTEYIGTWDVRVSVYGYALQSIRENPFFGTGFDDLSGRFYHPEDGFVLIHNILIRSWLQGGFALFASFSTLYVILLITILKSKHLKINAASCAILTTTLTFALTSAAFQQSYFWLIIIAAWAMVENWAAVKQTRLTLTKKPTNFSYI